MFGSNASPKLSTCHFQFSIVCKANPVYSPFGVYIVAKATAISFSFTHHIHSGKPSSKGDGFLHFDLYTVIHIFVPSTTYGCYPSFFVLQKRYKASHSFTYYFTAHFCAPKLATCHLPLLTFFTFSYNF